KGYLTPWQSQKLLKGDTDGFFLGGCRLLYKIASGSFGRVFRAEECSSGRVVAIKVLRRRWSDNPHNIELFGTFLSLYELGPDHRRFLEDQIDLVEQAREAFPVVFQHGDPGTWNLLARDDGTVAFLDWEAAERRGVPLWDVFHLARSFAVVSGRAKGERSMMRSIEQHLLSPTPINGLIADVVARYREQVGVPGDLVEPLFHLSWMHRALKEAMRLSEDRLRSSHYLALLRRGIELRSGAGLRRLLAGDGASA
ncbi:MAG: aminoglycoside phosphotransferase family protein, partial [Chloroflexi bacterium]|nr:aminoglycoside phosphotransferase family protein [Chloroflexota bacterium]